MWMGMVNLDINVNGNGNVYVDMDSMRGRCLTKAIAVADRKIYEY